MNSANRSNVNIYFWHSSELNDIPEYERYPIHLIVNIAHQRGIGLTLNFQHFQIYAF